MPTSDRIYKNSAVQLCRSIKTLAEDIERQFSCPEQRRQDNHHHWITRDFHRGLSIFASPDAGEDEQSIDGTVLGKRRSADQAPEEVGNKRSYQGSDDEGVGVEVTFEENTQVITNDEHFKNNPKHIRINGQAIHIVDYLNSSTFQGHLAELQCPTTEPVFMPELSTTLKPWQKVGVQKLVTLAQSDFHGGFLCDAVGLGKSLTALVAALQVRQKMPPGSGFILVVCRPSCVAQWCDEIKKHFEKGLRPSYVVLDSTDLPATELLKKDIVICKTTFLRQRYSNFMEFHAHISLSHAISREVADALIPSQAEGRRKQLHAPFHSNLYHQLDRNISVLILDEAHDAKNEDSELNAAVLSLAYKHAFLLTGTPMFNTWEDLSGQAQLLQGGGPFADLDHFRKLFGCHESQPEAPMSDGEPAYMLAEDGSLVGGIVPFVGIINAQDTRRAIANGLVHAQDPTEATPDRPQSQEDVARDAVPVEESDILEADEDLLPVKDAQPEPAGPRGAHRALFLSLFSGMMVGRPKSLLDLPKLHHTIVPVDLSNHPYLTVNISNCVSLGLGLLSQARDGAARYSLAGFAQLSKAQRLAANPILITLARSVRETLCDTHTESEEPNEVAQFEAVAKTAFETFLQSRGLDPTTSLEDLEPAMLRQFQNVVRRGVRRARIDVDPSRDRDPLVADDDDDDTLEKRAQHVGRSDKRFTEEWRKRLASKSDEAIFSPRVTAIVQTVRTIRERATDDKILIVSEMVTFLDVIKEALDRTARKDKIFEFGSAEFNGTIDSLEERAQIVRDFSQSSRGPTVLLLSAGAGGAGLNLTRASHIIISEPFWQPGREIQAVGRPYRLGQGKEVHVWAMVAEKSAIDKLLQEAALKKENFLNITGNHFIRADDEASIQVRIPEKSELN